VGEDTVEQKISGKRDMCRTKNDRPIRVGLGEEGRSQLSEYIGEKRRRGLSRATNLSGQTFKSGAIRKNDVDTYRQGTSRKFGMAPTRTNTSLRTCSTASSSE
jgi:hypothetical protein